MLQIHTDPEEHLYCLQAGLNCSDFGLRVVRILSVHLLSPALQLLCVSFWLWRWKRMRVKTKSSFKNIDLPNLLFLDKIYPNKF